jgi:outer membrane receptor protein involved in Fe transport
MPIREALRPALRSALRSRRAIALAGCGLWSGAALGQQSAPPSAARPLRAPAEQVQVTAYRSPVAALESPVSSVVLTAAEMQRAAAGSLDGKLRMVPGFDLFRRSSSLVANPTTEGVSLRGLGSTAASRTLVLLGDVPLNDPFGGWVHWEELPEPAVGRIDVVRGGVSDLYGSSAVGGVVQISTVPLEAEAAADAPPGETEPARLTLESSYGAEATNENGGLLEGRHGRWAGMAAAGVIGTDGYTLVAPNLRGAVDTNSNVHAQNALVLGERRLGWRGSGDGVWLRGNVLNESRHNGTPLTGNTTRLWRYAAGLDRGEWEGRAWGSVEYFRQDFSSVAPGRGSERLTRFVYDPADELGAARRRHHAVLPQWVLLAGADVRDVRAGDQEFPVGAAVTETTARQTDAGGYGESLWTPGRWLVSVSARVDRFRNADAATYTPASGAKTPLPSIEQTIADPRAGVSYRVRPGLAVSASGFRAYRAPTENELYRTGQVGQQTTLANPGLRAERTTGWESGLAGELPRRWAASWRGSWFWNEVNRPITALTLTTTPTATTLRRENLGQLRSRGVSADVSLHPAGWLAVSGGYQFARATVTRFAPEPGLVGKWIPQVPRNTGTAQLTASRERWGLLSVQARASGRQFDDDANAYVLHGFWRFDVYASHSLGQRWEVFTSVENLLDRSIDVGRTPIRTLGTPQLVQVGLRVRVPF